MNLQPIPRAPGKYLLVVSNGASFPSNTVNYAFSEVIQRSIPAARTSSVRNPGPFQIDISTPPDSARPVVTNPPSIQHISTLVFFDLETTGLPGGFGAPKVQITELSMVAVDKKDFERSQSSDLCDIRIINKICVCFRPTVGVSPGAARVTGLNDCNLQDHQIFDKDMALMIQIFISKLPKPICLLAHNGNVFDFPLLKAELEHAGVQLPADILTCDTLTAFRNTSKSILPAEDSSAPNKRKKSGGKTQRQSFSLPSLYKKYFNKKPSNSHSAEGDCVALMMVCHKMKDSILPWICQNTRHFTSFKSMWN